MFKLQELLNLPPSPWIIGHRGASGESPENTLESFQLAVTQGACMIEMDLQLTADGHIVVVHDWTLERLAKSQLEVEASTLIELSNQNVALHFCPSAPKLSMSTLPEVLRVIPERIPLNLELKCLKAKASEYIRTLAVTIKNRDSILLSSFNWKLLRVCQHELPNRLLAPIADETLEGLLEVATELSGVSVHCNHKILDDEFLRAADSYGYPVLVYTVNDTITAKRLFERGVSGIFTDYPGFLCREVCRP
jgi:glycerophosphoryl diester phosphodiesterase